MKCPKCQSENPEGANFCIACGRSLTPTSKAVSQALSLDEKLEKIGRYLPKGLPEKILAQKDRIEGERRQVTVMFCDMEGFTPMAEKLGSEETYSLMDHIYELLIHKVSDYEGTVNDLTGDGIMALFGAPIALEDAPQRALRSALSIHNAIARYNDQNNRSIPIKMRIGVHTGPVVVGTLGNDLRVQFSAVGNTVNLASRMEGLAKPETTYVTEETYRRTRGLFKFESLGRKTVKGKKEAVPVYELLSAKKDVYRFRLGSERMIYSDMVGRERAIDRLELQVMKVINGEGSVVSIIGEAGIGKSRLVAELKKREVMKRVSLFEGRAISIGKNLSFHPIIDLLKQWTRIREDDGEATALGKLEMAVRDVCPEQVYEILPFLAILMGMELSGRYAERVRDLEGTALDNLILKSFRELLIKATEQTPLVIVLEDMHWADTSSIELVKSLFRLAETQRVLFINIFRPGHEETGDRIAETREEKSGIYYVEIALDPLDDRMSEALITNMLKTDQVHHTFIRRIVDRAGGNPFFIEEVVRSLIDEGAVVVRDGTFTVTPKVSTIAIPNTVNDVVMARIDRLEEENRNLVKVASVIGRNFFYRLLQEVVDTVEDIDERLSYLKEIQLIRERKRMGEVEYLFKHTLAQEVAYESILPLKRKELHLKVARSIERIFEGRLHEFYGMLAFHYSRAEELDMTEEYLVKAGEEALKSSASNEALHYYREALELYLKKYGDAADAERIATLEKNIALALYNRGQYEEAVEYLDKALNHFWGRLPKSKILGTLGFLSAYCHFIVALYFPKLRFRRIPTQRDNEIKDLFHKKCEALVTINPKRFFIESFYHLKRVTKFDLAKLQSGIGTFMGASGLFSFTGHSFRISRKILDFSKRRIGKDDDRQLILVDLLETVHNYFKGNWNIIGEFSDDLVTKSLNLGEIWNASHDLFWHGLPSIYQGSLNTTESIVNRLNDIHEVYENDVSLMLKQVLNTSLLMESRDFHHALIEIEEGSDFARKIDYGLGLIHMYSCKARIQILMGDIEEAEASLRHVNKIRHEVSSVPWQLSNYYRSRSEYDLYRLEKSVERGNKTDLSEYRKKAIKSSKTLLKQTKKVAQHRTEAYRLVGVNYWLRKNQKRAFKWWRRSVKEGERLGAHLELSRTYLEIGKRLPEPGSKYKDLDGIKGEEFLKKAKELFEEMNLQWDLDQMGRVAAFKTVH